MYNWYKMIYSLDAYFNSHITRGDWSPKIFNIAYFVLVFPYSTFQLRSYKFETISYAIKLKNFPLTSGSWIIKSFLRFFR